MEITFREMERRAQEKWEKTALFRPSVDPKKKPFYVQVAFPYPSGAMHIGHARTYTITDIVAKYHMLKGYNVLMPMGWHVSGTPVIAAVEALQKGDEKTIKKFTETFRIPKKDLAKLMKPESYVDYMVNKAEYGYKAGFQKLGLGIDWRRELKTIDPQYKKFIEWQYKKLYSKGFIRKGHYPVRWCPHDKNPVGDHDLLEGEGVGIQEFTILKFKLERNRFLVAATLRPETVFGQTNIWLGSEVEYAIIRVGGEEWIGSEEFFEKLKEQKKGIEKIGTIKGSELVGRMVEAPGINRKIPVLPSFFCDTRTGTGIVTSVPSDAPIDYAALVDLQKDEDMMREFKLKPEEIKRIKVIPIIETEEYGEMAAVKIVEELKIENQFDRKLEEAKKRVYKIGFHKGIMNKNCGKYAGMLVSKAKELVKKELIESGKADRFWELEGKVVCRCGTECVVRVLEDQWFVAYSDPGWKEESKKTLAGMKIVPELFRTQYENVFEWLDDKPCTRSKGLGTSFPWQRDKIIEPLGDSTVYMAYFSISHLIKSIPAEKLNEKVFDFIFLGKGEAEEIAEESGIGKELLEKMRLEFNYWYPLAFNVSAIELIPNHMSFSIFQHTAIFPPEKRQLGTLNLGMLVLEGKKMSSSKGNIILINDMCERIGADYVRFFLVNEVEPWEEMNWKQRQVDRGMEKLKTFIKSMEEKARNSAGAGKLEETKLDQADRWLLNAFHSHLNSYLGAMEKVMLRVAIQEMTFKLAKDMQWYEKRKKQENKKLNLYIIKCWLKCIAPFMPHTAEEVWSAALGEKESIFLSGLPERKAFDSAVEMGEELIVSVLEDVKNIERITGKKPQMAHLFVAEPWKWLVLEAMSRIKKPEFKLALAEAMKNPEIKKRGKLAVQVVKRLSGKAMSLKGVRKFNELEALESALPFLERELGCRVSVKMEGSAGKELAARASSALPLKPAIFLE